ncbi:endo-1,4-beta-xylanase [Chitinophaga nivalis]|uniref:Beta-xylanase n=1 Tax=Chitinophaga nivalis TaxID=2991709 RepID=A0ABT3IS69_9BACT|nr:endo-1,4-beta-xylanase [Chitinophaga nivalis]MCW3463483.1 endo-1,4-beta-xylanase [Chitinophaga nivalis]MCW3486827.1 endo-1,4-beta-xylanase [Chitinophaga nivalis]
MVVYIYRNKFLTILLIIFIVFAIAFGCKQQSYCNTARVNEEETPFMDLLKGHDWQHFSGAVVKPEGIWIQGLDRGIVPKIAAPEESWTEDDNKKATDNPPYNLQGPYLRVQGDFIITATISVQSEKSALLYFCGQLPDIYDEWKQEGKAIAIGVKAQQLQLIVHDGKQAIHKSAADIGRVKKVQFHLKKTGDKIEWYVDNIFAGVLRDTNGIFASGKVYFGAAAERGSSFLLHQLMARAANTRSKVTVMDYQLHTVPYFVNTLRTVANLLPRHLYIGAALTAHPLLTDSLYARTAAAQYNIITPENDMKFQFIHPQRHLYAFAEADAVVDFAHRNKIDVQGHTLAWHEAIPAWVHELENNPEEIKKVYTEHISTVVSHYKGKLAAWDVVNEPIRDKNLDRQKGLRESSPWFKALGEQYIDIAFNLAHRIDPAAKLYINEYGVENLVLNDPNNKCNALYQLVKRLLQRRVPVHGIAFQMHEDMGEGHRPVDPEALAYTMKKFTDLGLEVRVSEMDVYLHTDKVTPSLQQKQATYFKEILAVCMNNPNCTGFSTRGFTDRYSSLGWRAAETAAVDYGNGLPFDTDMRPKPVYHALLQQLQHK